MKHLLNYIISLTVVFALIISCVEKETLLPIRKNSGDVIPIEEAMALLNKQMEVLYPETRSLSNRRITEVIPLTSRQLRAVTRTPSRSEIPDTAVYIFNFSDNSGYAVTSANRKYGNTVYCITEEGKLSPDDFRHTITKTTNDSSEVSTGSQFVAQLITASIMANEIAPPDATIGGGGNDVIPYGPYLTTKWTQGNSTNVLPFNLHTPNNAAAGCAAIAAAQIMVYNRYSNSMVFDGITCNWDTLASVKPYNNINNMGTALAQEQVGRFVYELGKSNNIHVRYNDGSWAQADGVKRAFSNFGYDDVEKHTGFGSSNIRKVDASLRAGYPVFVSGNNSFDFDDIIGSFYGHAWVIDGLVYPYYHINWGRGGISDGYYNRGVFKTTSRQATDSLIDANIPSVTMDEEYGWWYRIITYSL